MPQRKGTSLNNSLEDLKRAISLGEQFQAGNRNGRASLDKALGCVLSKRTSMMALKPRTFLQKLKLKSKNGTLNLSGTIEADDKSSKSKINKPKGYNTVIQSPFVKE